MASHGQQHQLLRFFHRKQAKQDLIEQREDRGIATDAERQRQDCNGAKHRIFRQYACGIP